MAADSDSPRHVSIRDAAAQLGVKPWDVVRLIEDRRVAVVEMVDVQSLAAYQQARQS